MKRAVVLTCAAILLALTGAAAGARVYDTNTNNVYTDLVRPNGHARSDAVLQADTEACYGQTGADRSLPDTPVFKQCMRGHHWRWLSSRTVRTPAAPASNGDDDWSFQGCVFNPAASADC